MEYRDVVTVFLRHGGRILLLRRSRRVGTYPGKWAGVSGYLEADPLAQAHTELREETSLSAGDIEGIRAGDPLEIVDAESGRAWRVHPFLADVKSPEKIRLDWENVEARWVLPGEVDRLDTVPALAEALRRVLG